MGLDTVEIVLNFEDEFDIRIPNEVAECMVTVGDMHRYIVERLVARGEARSPQLETDAWQRPVRIVLDQMAIELATVRPESTWIGDITRYG
jgi:hypothetical protein